MKVVVIGGGASGMMAAIAAAGAGARVTILEQNGELGKKILSTGNGKCNFTNIRQMPGAYRGEHPDFAMEVISRFPVPETIRFFLEMGLYSKNRDGYLYPHSEQAQAVRDVLVMELKRLQVKVETNVFAEKITKGARFHITAKRYLQRPEKKSKKRTVLVTVGEEEQTYEADHVILTAGGLAGRVQRADGTGMRMAGKLGHTIVPCVPALVQLTCEEAFYPKLSGVRAGAKIELVCGGEVRALDQGEIQFTDYGISGIPVFQISRFAAKALSEGTIEVRAELDFMPDFTKEQLKSFLLSRIQMRPEKPVRTFLTGVFHEKLACILLERAGISEKFLAKDLTKADVDCLVHVIKIFSTRITGTKGFDQAQVSAGGIATDEVDSKTMESRIVPGLFLAGEVLDIDGMCGGYNLQWAWSSGYVAGRSAAGKEQA